MNFSQPGLDLNHTLFIFARVNKSSTIAENRNFESPTKSKQQIIAIHDHRSQFTEILN
jgi:hypothetical protein